MSNANNEKRSYKPETRLKGVIKYLGITQRKLAESINREPSYINKMVTGKRNISMGVAEAIHSHYHISLDYLYGKSDAKMDEASTILKSLSEVFSEITATSQEYLEDNGEIKKGEFLRLSINQYLYNFLITFVHRRIKMENNEISADEFNDELEEMKKEYLINKDTNQPIQCVLIPCEKEEKIGKLDKKRKEKFDEVKSLWDDNLE